MVGNREVERLLKSGVSQAELTSGPSVAKSGFQPAVTALPTGPLIETSLKTGPPNHAGNIASGEIATVPPLVQEVLRSPGQPLDPATRAFMEPRFGHDFEHVRMHTDAKAADSARVVCAHAYTMGRNVVFGQNEFAPATHQGRELLAHELAHTIQQRNTSRTPASADSQEVFEASASAAARNVINGGTVARNPPACGLQIQRAPDRDPKRDEAARKAALRQYADPAWSDPLSPIREPESYDPKIYNVEVLRRKAAERKFDKYDQMEYGAHGVIYKKRGSGRVYANDIAAEDYKELTERYSINVSTDPHRVVLPPGRYAYETVYEGKLLKKVMEEKKLPPEAIHQVAAQLEAEAESGEYFTAAGIKPARFAGKIKAARFAGKAPAAPGASVIEKSASPNLTFPRGTDVTNRSAFDVVTPSRPVAGIARGIEPKPAPVVVPPGGSVSTWMPPARVVQGNQPAYGAVTPAIEVPATRPSPRVAGFRPPPKDIAEKPGLIEAETGPREYVKREYLGDVGPGGEQLSRYHVNVQVDKRGMMDADFSLRGGGKRSGSLFGKEEFLAAKQHFEQKNGAGSVKGNYGRWSGGDNLDTFNTRYKVATNKGLPHDQAMVEAARKTKTGEWARAAGFNNIKITRAEGSPGAYTNVEVEFTK
jgi:hypothetical protein